MNCAICLEEKAAGISCPQCSVAVCGDCFEKYLLTKDLIPTCHSCNHPWTDDYVDEAVTATFRNGALRDHKTKILLDQEVARMPELQDRARRYMMAQKGKRFLMNDIRLSIIRSTGAPIGVRWIRDDRVHDTDQYFGDSSWRSDSITAAPKPVKVLRACPGAGCRGFLNEIGTCALCTLTVCLKCMERKEEEHACNPETVATVALLVRDTKPCPTCHAPISKIDGCDQMWCTQCQTAFSWRTGQKEAGRVHNPHFYEWMRRTQGSVPREPDDRPRGCDALRHVRWFYGPLNCFENVPEHKHKFLMAIFESIHRLLAETEGYNPPPAPIQEHLNRLGVLYLAKELTQKKWARHVYLLKRQQARQAAIHEIKVAFFNAGRDIFNAWSERTLVTNDALKQLMELQLFMDAALKRCHKRFFYNSGDNFIADNWYRLMPRGSLLEDIQQILGDDEFDPKCYKVTPELYEQYINYVLTA